jgi:hypothetical protein
MMKEVEEAEEVQTAVHLDGQVGVEVRLIEGEY